MSYLSTVEIDRIARTAHQGQQRKISHEPYIHHPRRVALKFEDDTYRSVALLHDVIEDTEWTADDLLHAGVDPDVVEAVVLLTRRTGESYYDYITRILESGNPMAVAVKIEDIYDNLRDLPEFFPMRTRYMETLGRFLYQALVGERQGALATVPGTTTDIR